jgi:type III restriction enzyme
VERSDKYLHDTIASRTGGGLVAQLDFSATPKDNRGQIFKHVVCDSPLGEAVDGGIVKTPIIGKASDKLQTLDIEDASFRYERHLQLGYDRWKASQEEWKKSGKKALLFVMCEDTTAADQIARRLNTDEVFKELNGKTINLHTNLKGKIKKIGKGKDARLEFVESEKEISDEDLKELRKLSRELDSNTTHYNCIVSVLMLREGWDVRNVTTIVPLRPYTSTANILPEQTLGRGLRRITPPGQAHEIVTVVDHPAFASFYQEQLAQEGLEIEVVDVEKVPSTTISIFPDKEHKDPDALDLAVPALTAAHQIVSKLEGLTIDEVRQTFSSYKPLPLGQKSTTVIDYEGRQLFTDEIIEKLKIDLPLLQTGAGAVSYYVRQLEQICRLRGLHAALAPLIQTFLEEILFERKTDLFDPGFTSRLGDSDVGEHVRAIFIPLIRRRTVQEQKIVPAGEPLRLSQWKPFQVTHNERRPALQASKTLFNLVPCANALEQALARFVNQAPDVAAFAKNAGPQALRIDYLALGGRLAFYTPDFFVRTTSGVNYLVETKGRADRDVPRKARAAVAWCEAASKSGSEWRYLYVTENTFGILSGETVESLERTSQPSLKDVLEEETLKAQMPLFAEVLAKEEKPEAVEFVPSEWLAQLPTRYRAAVEQAIDLYRFLEKKPDVNFSPVFTPLLGSLDEAARGLLLRRLEPDLPARAPDQDRWFQPFAGRGDFRRYEDMAKNLKKTIVFRNGISPLGLVRNCMDYALNDNTKLTGVFAVIKDKFQVKGGRDLLDRVTAINDFRNTYVAHQDKELTDGSLAEKQLRKWVEGLVNLTAA